MSIRFEGMEEITDRLNEMADKTKVEAAIEKACLIVERAAKQKAPKGRTGDLAKSITHKIEDGQGIVYTPLEYAPYVEYGTGLFAEETGRTDVPWVYMDEATGEFISTSGQHPQPFMRPALDESREEILRVLGEVFTSD